MAMAMAEMARPSMRAYRDKVSDRGKGFYFEESQVSDSIRASFISPSDPIDRKIKSEVDPTLA
jgi:hypothetical protein